MTVRRSVPLAALLLTAGVVLGQGTPKKDAQTKEPSKPSPGSLEDTLEKSLRNSADVKAAEAKVRDAEAELNRVRHQVLTKATALHTDLNLAKRMLAVAEAGVAEQMRLRDAKAVGREGILAAQAMVEKHQGEVEKLETELKSLRGEFPIKFLNTLEYAIPLDGRFLAGTGGDGQVRLWDMATGKLLGELLDAQSKAAPAVPTPMFDRVKKLVDQEVQWKVENADVASAVTGVLAAAKSEVPVRDLLGQDAREKAITFEGKMSVGAWIQAIEDTNPKARVVVRDYGLLLTTADRVPPGALRVQDVWQGNYVQLRKDARGPEKK